MSIGKRVCCALISLGLLANTGCLVGGSSEVKREGNYISETTLNTIEPGHELWKYSYKETKEGDGYVFLIFAGSDKNVTGGNVFVEFKNDVVSKSWRG